MGKKGVISPKKGTKCGEGSATLWLSLVHCATTFVFIICILDTHPRFSLNSLSCNRHRADHHVRNAFAAQVSPRVPQRRSGTVFPFFSVTSLLKKNHPKSRSPSQGKTATKSSSASPSCSRQPSPSSSSPPLPPSLSLPGTLLVASRLYGSLSSSLYVSFFFCLTLSGFFFKKKKKLYFSC